MNRPNLIDNDLSTLCVWAAIELERKNMGEQDLDYYYTNRLSDILQKHSDKLLGGTDRLTLELYETVKTYPNGLCDDSVENYEHLSEKVKWIAQELKHAWEIPDLRLKDLVGFCCQLSRETINEGYDPYLIL
ncbi:MAG: hypothetical protein ACP5OG_00145 [Candidatus Nanoarchaeia archaeon]